MAFHHRSSQASSSSLSFSRSSSSSQSSPSPPSRSLLAHRSRSVASRPCAPSPSSAIVPFSWEEKPGVLKKNIMGCGRSTANVHKFHTECVCAAAEHTNSHSSSILHAPPRPLKAAGLCQTSPHICLPPCLSHPSTVEGCDFSSHLPPPCRNRCAHSDAASAATVRSKIMSSLSLHKRRHHHRRTPSLEDDPFWLAMVRCTNDEDKAPAINHPKGSSKSHLPPKACRTDSWLSRRLEQNIFLDSCMPRHAASENHEMRTKFQFDRGQYKAINQEPRCGTVIAGPSKSGNCPSSIKKSNAKSTDNMHFHNARDINLSFKHSDHSSGKPLKGLSLAKTELQGRCKALLHRQSPPVVDISCSSHRAAMAKKAHAFKSFRVAEYH